MKITATSIWVKYEERIRFRLVHYEGADGAIYVDIQFQILKKPFWFGWFRKSYWSTSIITNGFSEGLSFSKFLLDNSL